MEKYFMNIEEQVKDLIPNADEYIIGFANLTNLLTDKYRGCNYGIVIGKKLNDKIIDSISAGPNLDYYNLYNETNKNLSELQNKISKNLRSSNVTNIVIEPTSTDEQLDDEYYKTLKADFSHKMAATRAGIGWIGKTDLLISEKFGPRLRLATILVDYPPGLSSSPVNESKCGDCKLCVERCPAQAANGISWNINIDRNDFYDPFKCREKCREISWKNMKKRVSLCGICVSICPAGKRNR